MGNSGVSSPHKNMRGRSPALSKWCCGCGWSQFRDRHCGGVSGAWRYLNSFNQFNQTFGIVFDLFLSIWDQSFYMMHEYTYVRKSSLRISDWHQVSTHWHTHNSSWSNSFAFVPQRSNSKKHSRQEDLTTVHISSWEQRLDWRSFLSEAASLLIFFSPRKASPWPNGNSFRCHDPSFADRQLPQVSLGKLSWTLTWRLFGRLNLPLSSDFPRVHHWSIPPFWTVSYTDQLVSILDSTQTFSSFAFISRITPPISQLHRPVNDTHQLHSLRQSRRRIPNHRPLPDRVPTLRISAVLRLMAQALLKWAV